MAELVRDIVYQNSECAGVKMPGEKMFSITGSSLRSRCGKPLHHRAPTGQYESFNPCGIRRCTPSVDYEMASSSFVYCRDASVLKYELSLKLLAEII
jgi:hypothetical protein